MRTRGARSPARARLAALGLGLAGCSSLAPLTHPEGGGGWSAARREHELGRRAAAAQVPWQGAVAPEAAPLALAGRLDLAAALALAAARNLRVAEAQEQLQEARQRVFEVRGRLFPTTTAAGRWAWYTDEQTTGVSLDPSLLPPGVPPPVVVVQEKDFGTLNGTVTLPIDLSGELRHALLAAQAGYRGEAARAWAVRLEQDLAVTRAFFGLLEAQRLREVALQAQAAKRTQLDNAQRRYDEGRLTRNELLVVRVALSNSDHELLRRDLAIAQWRWALNQSVGLPVDAPTQLVDVTERPDVPPAEEALRIAYQSNPALLALLEEQQRLEAFATSLERGWLPRFEVGGAWDASTGEVIQPQDYGSAFAGFRWDLGTDTRRVARIAEARHGAQRNRIAIERELREIEQAVRGAQRGAEERLAALETARAALGQAEENLRIRQQQFDVGRATSEDVLDAQALLEEQRATLATSLYQAHTRRAELQRLMGRPFSGRAAAP